MNLFIAILFFLVPLFVSSAIYPEPLSETDALLIPAMALGNTNCSEVSSNTTFQLTFISYGNWTALPSQDDNPIQHLESISFAVSNAANSVSTVCAFPLSATLAGGVDDLTSAAYSFPFKGALSVAEGRNKARSDSAEPAWQACADRKDTDGKHQFTIATGAAFAFAERSLTVNQTWFCHDEVGRL
ncbi:hypothetical protein F5Y07DRAFT_412395 [Xylaria sp. FL0933]|nr:hypothetical protein F5Y07DRAFT_412395 [Xylaria sp. FL0933]